MYCLRIKVYVALVLYAALVLVARSAVNATPPNATNSDRVLVVVNQRPITEADLRFVMLSRKVPEELRSEVRVQLLQQMIDRRLLQSALSKRKVEPDQAALDKQVVAVLSRIHANADDPKKVLAGLGYTAEKLREELALPLTWSAYSRKLLTPKQLQDCWQRRKQEFDGTQVRAAQIVVKVDEHPQEARKNSRLRSPRVSQPETEVDRPVVGDGEAGLTLKAGLELLRMLRDEIVAGKRSFAAAAREHSQSPSNSSGGDMGYFTYHGRMPVAFSEVAFTLKVDAVSEPFATRFGVHLLTVTDRKPGQLSLEDARDRVFKRLADQLRIKLVQQERTNATIEWKVELK